MTVPFMHFLHDFFHMGGYGFYVWSAYGCVFFYLFIQWFVSWRRWQYYLRKQMLGHGPKS